MFVRTKDHRTLVRLESVKLLQLIENGGGTFSIMAEASGGTFELFRGGRDVTDRAFLKLMEQVGTIQL